MVHDTTRASLELLYHISRELASALDLRTVLQSVLTLSLANVGGERGSIVVLDDRGQPVDAAIVYGKRIHNHTTQQLRDIVERGMAGWVVRNGKAVLVSDTSRDERWLRRPDDAVDRSGPKSAICVPLLARERLVGVLTVVHPVPGTFNEDHLALIQAIADQAGIAILNGRLYDESQRQARVMTALAESAVTMNASLRLEEVLQRILEQTAQALRVELVALALADEERQELVFRAASGQGAQNMVGVRFPFGDGVAGKVAQEGRGRVVLNPKPSDLVQFPGMDAQAIICAPVQSHGHVIGSLEAINPMGGNVDPDALLVLTGLGSLAGTAIQNAQLYERLESTNRRYHELFEDSIDPILITDSQGNILEANRRASATIGYDQAALQRQTIGQLHKVNLEKVGEDFTNLSDSGACTYESSLQTHSGRILPIQVYVRKLKFEGIDSLQWIFRDISERKDLDALREDLLAMIYHDLRSPLANVVSSLDVLATLLPQDANPSIQAVLNIAVRSTDRIQRLINSLLDIRRLEAGQPIASQAEVDSRALINEALETVNPTLENRRQEISVSLAEDLPDLWVDADMIRRVLINLLENAIKFTPAGGHLGIGAQRDGQWLTLWVQDDGPGIPTAQQERIFEKFARLQIEGSPKGMGLGLAYCRLAVEAHGGKIWVESQVDEGSRFFITLPLSLKN